MRYVIDQFRDMLDYVTTVYGYDIANRITSMLLQGGTTPKLVRKDTVAS